jgi:hypothetical protein
MILRRSTTISGSCELILASWFLSFNTDQFCESAPTELLCRRATALNLSRAEVSH